MKSASFLIQEKTVFLLPLCFIFLFGTPSSLDFSHLSEFYLLRNDAQYAYHLQPYTIFSSSNIHTHTYFSRSFKFFSLFFFHNFLSFFPFRIQKKWENFVFRLFDGNINNNNICYEKKGVKKK